MNWILKKAAAWLLPFKGVTLAVNLLQLVKIFKNIFYMEKGVLTNAEEKWLAAFLDSVVKAKGMLEIIDGPAFRVIIAIGDNYAIEKYVREGNKNFIKEAIALAKAHDKKGISDLIMEKAKLDNEVIKNMGSQAVDFILSAVYEYVDNKEINLELV